MTDLFGEFVPDAWIDRIFAVNVRGLILANTRAGADSAEARDRRQRMIALAREHGSSAIAEAMLPGMIGKTSREKSPELVAAVHRMMSSAPVPGVGMVL